MARYKITKVHLPFDSEYWIYENGDCVWTESCSLRGAIHAKKVMIQQDKRIKNMTMRRLIQIDKQNRKRGK